MQSTARRLAQLVDPIHVVTYFADEPTEELMALGHRNYWDGYFASRAAPLGPVSAEVVHAVFYNFAPGEVARHVPRVWDITTPEVALAARERGSHSAGWITFPRPSWARWWTACAPAA
jgi:helix-turn-helix protein